MSTASAGGVRPALAAAAAYSSGRVWVTLAHSTSAAASRSSVRPNDSRQARAASATRPSLDSTSRGGSPPMTFGQK